MPGEGAWRNHAAPTCRETDRTISIPHSRNLNLGLTVSLSLRLRMQSFAATLSAMESAKPTPVPVASLVDWQWDRVFGIHDRALPQTPCTNRPQMRQFLGAFDKVVLLQTSRTHICGYVFYSWHTDFGTPILEVEWMMVDPDCRSHAQAVDLLPVLYTDAAANGFDPCYTVVLLSEKGLRRVLQWCDGAEYFGQTDPEQPLQIIAEKALPIISRGRFNRDGRHCMGFGSHACDREHESESDQHVCDLSREADGRVWIVRWSLNRASELAR